MSYTTFGDATSFDRVASPRSEIRPFVSAVAKIGCGVLSVAALIAVTMATRALLASFAGPHIEVKQREQTALPPSLDRQAPLPAAFPSAPPEDGERAANRIAAAEPPVAAEPEAVPRGDGFPLPPVVFGPALVTPPLAFVVGPAPAPYAFASGVEPPRPGPGTSKAPSSTVGVLDASPPVAAAMPGNVPLPPRRPAGPLGTVAPARTETSVAPPVQPPPARTETSAPSPVQPLLQPEAPRASPSQVNREAVPQAARGIQQRSSAAGAASSPSQPDNRNILQRLFGALSQPFASGLPGAGSGTALYDISAHTVYMPNGERLEAHSGLGNKFDDPRSGGETNRGVTPPQTYELSLRKDLFHGVAALRLNPVGDGNMYGRVGMLAHSYMLGPRGDSNGCVSFRDYQKFLDAYRRGEVTRLVVVAGAGESPSSVASRQ